jgi:hypothetical protein
MNRSRRHSTITVRGLDGEVHQGDGQNMAQAVRQLGETHAAEARYTLTVAGAYVAAAFASDDYLADDTIAAAETMLARFELAERIADSKVGR